MGMKAAGQVSQSLLQRCHIWNSVVRYLDGWQGKEQKAVSEQTLHLYWLIKWADNTLSAVLPHSPFVLALRYTHRKDSKSLKLPTVWKILRTQKSREGCLPKETTPCPRVNMGVPECSRGFLNAQGSLHIFNAVAFDPAGTWQGWSREHHQSHIAAGLKENGAAGYKVT